MATKTTAYGYINIPNSFFYRKGKDEKTKRKNLFDRKLPAGELLAVASVYSLSSEERELYGFKKKKNRVKFTVSSFASRYNVSASTSRRALARLETCEKIESTEEGMYFDADKMKDGKEKGYLHVEEWLFFAKFSGEYLTKSEVLVLAKMLELAKGTMVKDSYRNISRNLGLSPTWVMNASDKLERLGIINILSRSKGNSEKTICVINKAYLEEVKSEMVRTLRQGTSEGREKYYENLQKVAKERRLQMFNKACEQDPVFKKLYGKWFKNQKDEKLKEILKQRLQQIGMSWEDVRYLQYCCEKCKDTGTLPNGKPCNCYGKNE